MKKIMFKTKDMHCESCETLVKDELVEMNGIKQVTTSHKENTIIVKFDETKTTIDKIKQAIETEGYKVITYGNNKTKI